MHKKNKQKIKKRLAFWKTGAIIKITKQKADAEVS